MLHGYMIWMVHFVILASLEKSHNINNYCISHCIIILCWGNSLESLNSFMNFHYNQNETVESFLSSGSWNKAKKSLSFQQTVSQYNRNWNNPWERIWLRCKSFYLWSEFRTRSRGNAWNKLDQCLNPEKKSLQHRYSSQPPYCWKCPRKVLCKTLKL